MAAQTYADQLTANGASATIVQVGSVSDIASALTSNGEITGGVSYFGHAGGYVDESGMHSALFVGQNPGAGTNLTSENVGSLSGAKLGPNASFTINACEAGLGGKSSIAQSLATQLNRGVYAYDKGMFFSNNPNARSPSTVSGSQPVYMNPLGGARPLGFVPQ